MKAADIERGRKYYGGPNGHGRFILRFEQHGSVVVYVPDDAPDDMRHRRCSLKEFMGWIAEREALGFDPKEMPKCGKEWKRHTGTDIRTVKCNKPNGHPGDHRSECGAMSPGRPFIQLDRRTISTGEHDED